jgi:hypothetical protein
MAWLMFVPLVVLVLIIGLALHATYTRCDPAVIKAIDNGDQVCIIPNTKKLCLVIAMHVRVRKCLRYEKETS